MENKDSRCETAVGYHQYSVVLKDYFASAGECQEQIKHGGFVFF